MTTAALTVVGTGYRVAGQTTPETCTALQSADRVFYLVSDPATSHWLRSVNPSAQSLHDCYQEDLGGLAASEEMVERILAPLRQGQSVCAAFYGHPAIFMHPPHEALRRARLEGFDARMLPAVSSVDCLFADLGVDPSLEGYQIYEATDFLVRRRVFDASIPLILLQVGAVGVVRFGSNAGPNLEGLRLLVEALGRHYAPDHGTILYQIAQLPPWEPMVREVPLSCLMEAPVSVVSTLFVPAAAPARPDAAVR